MVIMATPMNRYARRRAAAYDPAMEAFMDARPVVDLCECGDDIGNHELDERGFQGCEVKGCECGKFKRAEVQVAERV